MWKQCENKPSKTKTGKLGEEIAADYLKKHGYKILKMNESYPWGEIDIVAKDCENTLVFVEVKTFDKRGQKSVRDSELRPEDNLTWTKMERLKKSSLFFANENKEIARNGWRIDLISLTIYDRSCDVKHLENIG